MRPLYFNQKPFNNIKGWVLFMIFMFFYLLNQDLLLVGIYSIYFQLGLKFQNICEGLKNFKGSI